MLLKKQKTAVAGLFAGLCNALFGAGAGLLAVPYFRHQGIAQRQSQALSLAVTLPLSALSAAVSSARAPATPPTAMRFTPDSHPGAAAGPQLLPRCSDRSLQVLFALLMLWCGLRLLLGG